MRDAILAQLAKRTMLSNADLCVALNSTQSIVSKHLAPLYREGSVSYKKLAHGKKLWFLVPNTEVKLEVVESYVVERTLNRVREIQSVFSYQ